MCLDEWDKKRKRIYGRLISAGSWLYARSTSLFFLTLTTKGGVQLDVERSFKILVQRIKRLYGGFEYIRIKTEEGYGVLHILFWGPYLEVNLLRYWWGEIHSGSVQLRLVEVSQERGFANIGSYICGRYLIHHRYLRMSMTPNFFFRGSTSYFKNLIKVNGFVVGLKKWKLFLLRGSTPVTLVQSLLDI